MIIKLSNNFCTKTLIIFIACLFMAGGLFAQDVDLLKGIEDTTPKTVKVTRAFKSTRVINAHSTEMLPKGTLDFRILHRFGPVKNGMKDFFGLDDAYMRMSFDYGITDNFTIGGGRSSFRKEYDVFGKLRVLQQSKGNKAIPLSVVVAAGAMVYTETFGTPKPDVSDRSAYYVQLIAGRKFSERFSLQLSPIFIHRNQLLQPNDEKNIIAIGGGGRLKLSKRFALTFDYHHAVSGLDEIFRDPLSLGVDIETGGHVFQLHFSNAIGMNERAFISQNTDKFFDGGIRFGFNLSRVFKLGKRTM
jgi:hypothetical protein